MAGIAVGIALGTFAAAFAALHDSAEQAVSTTSSPWPLLPATPQDSSVKDVKGSEHGYLTWGPAIDLFPEVAKQVDCLTTPAGRFGRVLMALERPIDYRVSFRQRDANGRVWLSGTAKKVRYRGTVEYVARLRATRARESGPAACWGKATYVVPVDGNLIRGAAATP